MSIAVARPVSLREAMVKCRFAETILKAKLAKLNGDPVKIQQEKERLEKRQREENARLQAKIKLSQALQLKKQRQAARLALIDVEKSVVIDDNFETLRELKSLFGSQVVSMEGLGLILKRDVDDDDDDDDDDDASVVAEKELLRRRRDAARNAIQRMELSVEIDEESLVETERQLERLCGCRDPLKRVLSGYPLRSLGLVLKEEFRDDDEEKEEDIEEGEIVDLRL